MSHFGTWAHASAAAERMRGVSPPDVAIDHLLPPYTPEKNGALTQWFGY